MRVGGGSVVRDRRHAAPNVDNIHIARRVQHAVTGLVLLVVSHIIPPYPVGCLLLLMATAVFYCIHKKRVQDPKWDEWYLQKFGSLLRNHERGEWEVVDLQNNMQCKRRRKSIPELPGAFYFLLGAVLSTFLFPATVARTSVLVLSLSDPIAGLVGSWFTGKGCNIAWKQLLSRANAPPEGGPSVAGSFGFVVSTILCTYVYIPSTNSTRSVMLSFYSRLFIGVVASLTEAVGGRHFPFDGRMVDDNLLIPLVVGCLICWIDADE
mmetsp:Transcript_11751/g.17517  ORF Transcript_11751/g.17517 Transcript_11751/m.17517 type:complete len:265 (-) Transcript_11751:65-859(-)